MECHASPIRLMHPARDASGAPLLFVRHEDDCVSILRDKPKPECLVSLTNAEWLKAIVGLLDEPPYGGNGLD